MFVPLSVRVLVLLLLVWCLLVCVCASSSSSSSSSHADSTSSNSQSNSQSQSQSQSDSRLYTGHTAQGASPDNMRIPDEYNFCSTRSCTPTWNQYNPQYCGSCWIHAALSSISDRMLLLTDGKVNTLLARQDVLNCGSSHHLGDGCKGGEANDVFEYVHRYGIPDETCNTYTGILSEKCDASARCQTCPPPESEHADPTSTCQPVKEYTTYHITSYGSVLGEVAMRAEIYARGPIVCGMALSNRFAEWHGYDIYKEKHTKWTEKDINHDILVVGWGQEKDEKYWIVKNSFGSFWGNEGYGRLARGVNESLVLTSCDFPVLDRETYIQQHGHGEEDGTSINTFVAMSQHMTHATDEQVAHTTQHVDVLGIPMNTISVNELIDSTPPDTSSSSSLSISSILALILSIVICVGLFTTLYLILHVRINTSNIRTALRRSMRRLVTSSSRDERTPILTEKHEYPEAEHVITVKNIPKITIPETSTSPIISADTAASIASTVTSSPEHSPESTCSSTSSSCRSTPCLKSSSRRLILDASGKPIPSLPKRVSFADFHSISIEEFRTQAQAVKQEIQHALTQDGHGKLSPPAVIPNP